MRENTAILYGIVKSKPKIIVNKEGEIKHARFEIETTRYSYLDKNNNLAGNRHTDEILVFTKNTDIIRHIVKQKIDEGDMAFVKGNLCTIPAAKTYFCKNCHEEISTYGMSVFIDPIFVCRWEKKIPSDDQESNPMKEILENKYQISNSIMIFGYLCNNPTLYQAEDSKYTEAIFQIASDRKRRIRLADERTDFPWVKVKGPMAKEVCQRLKKGAEVYINGSIRSERIQKNTICPYCHTENVADDRGVEIVPYKITYGRNSIDIRDSGEEATTNESD